MKVFISWSGERSKKVAELLDSWLQCVIQAVSPWISYRDIDRGSLWFTEISNILAETSVGIICITNENKNEPWILFEAGALAKGINSSRVCTFLIDLQPNDIGSPLAQFNHTLPTRESIFRLVCTINGTLGDDALNQPVLGKVFETYWPQFEQQFDEIMTNTPALTKPPKRDNVHMMDEILSVVRSLDRRLRDIEIRSERKQIPLSSPSIGTLVRQKIESLVSTGMPSAEIRVAIREEFPTVPTSFVVRVIRETTGIDRNKIE